VEVLRSSRTNCLSAASFCPAAKALLCGGAPRSGQGIGVPFFCLPLFGKAKRGRRRQRPQPSDFAFIFDSICCRLRPAGALLSCSAKKSRQKKAALRLPATALCAMAGSLTPCHQSGEEKNSPGYADATTGSDSFSSTVRMNGILFGGTRREMIIRNRKGPNCYRVLFL